jgi:hypothetical protein
VQLKVPDILRPQLQYTPPRGTLTGPSWQGLLKKGANPVCQPYHTSVRPLWKQAVLAVTGKGS